MADLSNVPPEVLKILTHDPPYSQGELQVLRAYAARPDANPVLVRAFQNPSLGITPPPSPPSSDFGIPGLDIPDNIAGIGLPTADFMQGLSTPPPTLADSSAAFHQDLRHQGAADINMATAVPASSGVTPFPTDSVTPTTQAGAITGGGFGLPTRDFMDGWSNPFDPQPDTTLPERRDVSSGSPLDAFLPTPDPVPGSAGGRRLGQERTAPAGPSTGMNWKSVRDLERTLVPPDSAFANIPDAELNKFAMLVANPELLAGKLYEGTPMTAASATPMVGALAQLAKYGLLSPGNQMVQAGGFGSDLNQARMVEETLNSMKGQMGAEVSPRAIYEEAFRRTLNTDVKDMDATSQVGGEAGDLANQIAVTNSYLLLAQPFISQGQQDFFKSKLDRWAEAYAQQWVNGETDVSYPQWLSDHGAQNLLGG